MDSESPYLSAITNKAPEVMLLGLFCFMGQSNVTSSRSLVVKTVGGT